MRIPALLDRLGIRGRVLFLAAIPVLAVSMVLGYTLITSRLDDARATLDLQGRVIARNLALAAEFPVFSRNSELLNRVVARIATEGEVRWAAVWDRSHVTVFSEDAEVPDLGEVLVWVEGGLGEFEGVYHYPIGSDLGQFVDFAEEFEPVDVEATERQRADNLGWALIGMSPEGIVQREAAIVRSSILITLAGVLFSIILGLAIGNGITEPIRRLMGAVQQLRAGKLDTRVRRSTGGEIGELEAGINQMAGALEEGQATLRERVELATNALRDSVAELERKNLELEQAQQAALKAGHERTLFLARMSHEIRTPLNAVVGFARMLEDLGDGPPPADYIRTIQAASRQLQHVIDDILQFIRLDAKADELEYIQFDPADCLEDVVAMLGPMAAEKGLELTLLLHSDLPRTIRGDPGRLAQVVVNLANNAVKFTEHGHVVIEAGFEPTGQNRGRMQVTVVDTGPGLSPQDRESIFSAFSQGDSSVTRRHGGAGLGLSIAKRLVELMGGDIAVTSDVGQGARFTVSIPCAGCSAPRPVEKVPGLWQKSVLLYDRNGFTRRALRGMAFAWGMKPFNTGKIDQLTAQLDSGEYDLVILGLSPTQSNEEVAASLVADVRARHTGPVLLLSGVAGWQGPSTTADDPRVTLGMKPVRRARFRSLLVALMTGESLGTQAQGQRPGADAQLSGLRVLAAEDNEFNRLLLQEALTARGAKVELAVDGRDAVDKARFQEFDVVLMDLHMPRLDGAQAARLIRQALGERTPPVIALTADVFGESHLDPDHKPFDAWLLKPIDTVALGAELRRLCHGDATQAPRGTGRPTPAAAPTPGDTPRLPPALRRRYLDEIEALCAGARSALLHDDTQALREHTHDLLGIAGVMGLVEAAAIAADLDAAAKAGDRTRAAQLVQALERCACAAAQG